MIWTSGVTAPTTHEPVMTSIAALKAQLKAARAQVNMSVFGTDAFEQSMDVVRALVEQIDALQPAYEYTSIDGDIFQPVA